MSSPSRVNIFHESFSDIHGLYTLCQKSPTGEEKLCHFLEAIVYEMGKELLDKMNPTEADGPEVLKRKPKEMVEVRSIEIYGWAI